MTGRDEGMWPISAAVSIRASRSSYWRQPVRRIDDNPGQQPAPRSLRGRHQPKNGWCPH